MGEYWVLENLATAEILPLILALFIGGALTGFMAGLLGIGGGAILVPILYELFRFLGVDQNILMHLSVGTSLAVILPTSIQSARKHDARGALDRALVKSMALPLIIGVGIGTLIASSVEGNVLKMTYIAVCTFIAAKLVAGEGAWQLANELPKGITGKVIGGIIGILSTLIGVGGGAMMTSYMTIYGRNIHNAVATSAGMGPVIALPATLGYVWAGWSVPNLPPGSFGYVSLLGALIVAPLSVITAPLGVATAHGISRRSLELAFATFLTFVAFRFYFAL